MTGSTSRVHSEAALRDVNFKPPLVESIPLGIQHVLAMFVGNVTVPLIIAGAINLPQVETIFGAGILRKEDMSLVIAGTNKETENPLWHGEVHTLKLFYEIPVAERPQAKDCIFLTTHEPCSLCLSAITWTGFDNFYYLFGYKDTVETFNIPHDLKILQEVFAIKGGNYVRENDFWTSNSIEVMIANLPEGARVAQQKRVEELNKIYSELSATYQKSKQTTDIPYG